MKKEKIITIIEKGVLQIILFTAMVSFLLCEFLVTDANEWVIMGFSVLCSIALQLILLIKEKKYVYITILGLLCILMVVNFFVEIDFIAIFELIWVQILFMSAVAAAIAQIVCKYHQLTRVIIILLFIGMVVSAFFNFDLTQGCCAMILVMTAFTLVELNTKMHYKDKDSLTRRKGSSSLMIFCIIPIIMILFVPKTEEPLQWTLAKRVAADTVQLYKNTKDFIVDVRYGIEDIIIEMQFSMGIIPEKFQMNFTGYSGEGKLSGNVMDSDREMLYIGGNKPRGNTYFTGSISSIYTGSSWEKSAIYKSYELNDYKMDTAEMLRALYISSADKEVVDDIMNISTMTVEHAKIRTKTLFYPIKTMNIENYNEFPFEVDGPNISFERPLVGNCEEYKITYLDIDYESEEFVNLLESYKDFSYDSATVKKQDIIDVQQNYFGVANSSLAFDNMEKELAARAKDIETTYTQLPDTLPQRVYDLADEITEGCETPYDKMQAIQKYLTDYSYEKEPQVGTSSDFVDAFLFEGKEGYCTYFSTAAAVLGRCAGVPTRYVEGFYCDYANKKVLRDCVVSSNRGHAWCEYYVEGIGWIPIEVTTGCGYFREYRHAVQNSRVPYMPTDIGQPTEETSETELPELPEEEDNSGKVRLIITVIGGSVVSAAMLTVLILVLIRMYKQKKMYRNADRRGKIKLLFAKMQNLLKELSSVSENELPLTATDWFQSLAAVSTYDQRSQALCATYLCVCYNNNEITDDEVRSFEEVIESLKDDVKKKKKEEKRAKATSKKRVNKT